MLNNSATIIYNEIPLGNQNEFFFVIFFPKNELKFQKKLMNKKEDNLDTTNKNKENNELKRLRRTKSSQKRKKPKMTRLDDFYYFYKGGFQ